MEESNSEAVPGPHPIDAVMTQRGISNAYLVGASTEQLTFKMVQKARKGKRLTPNVQRKILSAFQALDPAGKWNLKRLFNH